MPDDIMKAETYSDRDWFESYEKERTRACAKTSINIFKQFCHNQTGLNGKSKDTMIDKYKNWYKPKKVKDEDGDYYYPDPDIRSICISLKKLVKFMQEEHPEIVFWTNPHTGKEHTFTSGTVDGFAPEPDGKFDSGILNADQSFEYTADTVGEFPYYCMLHVWMQGVLIVQ